MSANQTNDPFGPTPGQKAIKVDDQHFAWMSEEGIINAFADGLAPSFVPVDECDQCSRQVAEKPASRTSDCCRLTLFRSAIRESKMGEGLWGHLWGPSTKNGGNWRRFACRSDRQRCP